MAKRRQRKRPEVGTLTVDVDVDVAGRRARRSGPRLDDVVRVILFDLVRSYGAQSKAARRLGVTQQNLSRIGRGGGTSLDLLGRICAGLRESPVELFRRYEGFRSDADPESGPELERLGSLLSGRAARRLAALVAEVVDQGELEDFLRMGESYAYRSPPALVAERSEAWDGPTPGGELEGVGSRAADQGHNHPD